VSGNRDRYLILVGIILTGILVDRESGFAQSPGRVPTGSPESYQLKETEITGQLRDVLGSVTLSEGEVVGTVPRPRLSYSLPWKDPDPLPLDEGDVAGEFREEIYTPLDKDTFAREIEQGKALRRP
jgi:hypothetical protein